MKTYIPKCSVTLFKRIPPRLNSVVRLSMSSGKVDLTPFLGEGSSIVVEKDVRQPAGAFSIRFIDRPGIIGLSGFPDDLYGLIEPMDYVEIRFARSPEEYYFDASNMPIIMRGFICSIERTQSIGPDGRPIRYVTITGQDYGKIAQNARIFLRSDYQTGVDILTEWRLYVDTGWFSIVQSPLEFMTSCQQILNSWIDALNAASTPVSVPRLLFDCDVANGRLSPYSMSADGESIWELMMKWADVPWTELFFEDHESGPCIVYRYSRCRDINGHALFLKDDQLPWCLGAGGQKLELSNEHITSLRIARSDTSVANYFWVHPIAGSINSPDLLNVESLANGRLEVTDNPNCSAAYYGLRIMKASTIHFAEGASPVWPSDLKGDQANVQYMQSWCSFRREALKAMNQDNAVFDSGSIEVMGNERIRPGRYLAIHQGGLSWDCYVRAVRHVFEPFQSFSTTIEFERGTCFLARSKAAGSPYYAESPRGAYG